LTTLTSVALRPVPSLFALANVRVGVHLAMAGTDRLDCMLTGWTDSRRRVGDLARISAPPKFAIAKPPETNTSATAGRIGAVG